MLSPAIRSAFAWLLILLLIPQQESFAQTPPPKKRSSQPAPLGQPEPDPFTLMQKLLTGQLTEAEKKQIISNFKNNPAFASIIAALERMGTTQQGTARPSWEPGKTFHTTQDQHGSLTISPDGQGTFTTRATVTSTYPPHIAQFDNPRNRALAANPPLPQEWNFKMLEYRSTRPDQFTVSGQYSVKNLATLQALLLNKGHAGPSAMRQGKRISDFMVELAMEPGDVITFHVSRRLLDPSYTRQGYKFAHSLDITLPEFLEVSGAKQLAKVSANTVSIAFPPLDPAEHVVVVRGRLGCSPCISISKQSKTPSDQAVSLQLCHTLMGVLKELGDYRTQFMNKFGLINLFPTVYFNTTRIELRRLEKGEFNYPIEKIQQMVAFYDAYKANRAAWDHGKLPERHWAVHFEGAADADRQLAKLTAPEEMLRVSSLLNDVLHSGITAHVHYDLARALRFATSKSIHPEVKLESLKVDFLKTVPTLRESAAASRADIQSATYPGINGLSRAIVDAIGSIVAAIYDDESNVIRLRNAAWEAAFDGTVLTSYDGISRLAEQPVGDYDALRSKGRSSCHSREN